MALTVMERFRKKYTNTNGTNRITKTKIIQFVYKHASSIMLLYVQDIIRHGHEYTTNLLLYVHNMI